MVNLDRQLFLALNGSDNTILDTFFMAVTHTTTWVPLFIFILYVLMRQRPWRQVMLILACTALVVLIADQFSSSLCKPLFHRLRPSHEPALDGLVDLVDGYRGGMYGFISSHAANTFGVATFLTLILKHSSSHSLPAVDGQGGSFSLPTGEGRGGASSLPAVDGQGGPFSLPTGDGQGWARASVGLLFLWALLSSYSRIYLGVHYPGDILAGACCGTLIAFLVFRYVFTPIDKKYKKFHENLHH